MLETNIHCVLKPKESLSSALKFVYLVTFLYAIFKLIEALFHTSDDIISLQHLNVFSDAHEIVLIFKVFFYSSLACVVLHHVRLYLTIEMLEDPSNPMHREMIYNLGPWGRGIEQLVRIIIALFIGLKAYDVFSEDPTLYKLFIYPTEYLISNIYIWLHNDVFGLESGLVNVSDIFSKKSLIALSYVAYLFNIFVLLLIWDIVINHRSIWNLARNPQITWRNIRARKFRIMSFILGKNSYKFSLVLSHIFGSAMCMIYLQAYLLFDSKSIVETALIPTVLMFGFLMFFSISYTLLIVLHIWKHSGDYLHEIHSIGANLMRPNYGEQCSGTCLAQQNSEQSSSTKNILEVTT